MFKVAGPMWAQATAGGDNVFARLVKTGKKVWKRVLQQREVQREVPKPTWSLRSHTIKVDDSTATTASRRLIGGLFPKKVLQSQAAELRRQAALRLVRDARKVPVFAFVGLSLSVGASTQQKTGEKEDVLYSGIRDLFQQYGGKAGVVEREGQHFSLQTLQLGPLIGQGCNAAVFGARPAPTHHAEDQEEVEAASPDPVPDSVDTQSEPAPGESSLQDDSHQSPVSTITESTTDDDNENTDVSITSEDDDDDFCIIGEEEEEEEGGDGLSEEVLDGWTLYRLSSVPASPSSPEGAVSDDCDDDIIILARDEGSLESLPDFEDLGAELRWLGGSEVGVDSGGTASEGSAPDTSLPSPLSSLSSGQTDSPSVPSQEPEPAPNIRVPEGGGHTEFPLAVKMMYNYSVESRTDHIMRAMARETVPTLHPPSHPPHDQHSLSVTKRLPPHPNIVTMYDVFVDETPDQPEGQTSYPNALPRRLNNDGGFGRNSTMFLVMKKYNMTLNEFLTSHTVSMHTRCLLFSQLLEGLSHLGAHGVAHRDLKSNNVLVDLSHGPDSPILAISDFGSCLADDHYGLQLPYPTVDTDKGGNSALMAPEIKCAVPGPGSVLDYSRADMWAAGSLAFEIFGEVNPFYNGLDSRSYCQHDLPKLPDDTPKVVVKLVDAMLKRNPSERPSPAVAATCLALFLWAPQELSPFSREPSRSHCSHAVWRLREISHWLEALTMETVCQRVFGLGGSSPLNLQAKATFLSRVSRQDVFGAVSFEG